MTHDAFGRGSGDVRIGVDIGGTFTDVVAFDPAADETRIGKVPSTRPDPADGVVDGLDELVERTGLDPGDVSVLSHGSTVTVNALLERDGAVTGLLVTEGFAAVPLARHGEKPDGDVKNPRYRQPDPLVPQERVLGVPERVGADGEVVEPLDEDAVREAVAGLRGRGVESIAVSLLFSFANPDHERRVGELVAEEHSDCAVSLSSDVAPRIREYPRLSTTTVGAYVDPAVSAYLASLERQLAERGFEPEDLSVMLSHGGLTDFATAADRPASTVFSGPAAGVQGALFAARLAGERDVVTMDMGGTSCDVALAPGGEPVTTTDKEVASQPVSVPTVDVQSIGAGGGTVARVEGGRLRVGPGSAGADPGPACYGRGGDRPTVTDANAVLGRLRPGAELAGAIRLDVEAAAEAVRAGVAEPLGVPVTEAAEGVVEVVNTQMRKELSLVLTRRGHDPREFALVVYGGAGPMHAPAVARALSIRRVVVPPRPGINSAVGLLTTDRRRIYERSRVDPLDEAPVGAVFGSLEEGAGSDLSASGVPAADVTFERELELRYAGQSYELSVPVGRDPSPGAIAAAFDARHEEAFGHTGDRPVETMTYRTVATVETETLSARSLAPEASGDATPRATRPVRFGGADHGTAVYHRSDLGPGSAVRGPAIVEQTDATVVVEPGMRADVDGYGNLLLTEVDG